MSFSISAETVNRTAAQLIEDIKVAIKGRKYHHKKENSRN